MAWIVRFCLLCMLCNTAVADNDMRELRYTFTVRGLDNHSIEKRFNASSSLITFKETPLYSRQILNKRISDDYDLLIQLLEGKGFYDGEIKVSLVEKGHLTEVVFDILSGQRYRLKTVTIDLGGAKEDLLEVYPFLFEGLPIQVGRFVSAERVHETFDLLLKNFGNCGYPYAKIKGHEVELLKDLKRIILIIDVDPGPKVRFGDIIVTNHVSVPESFVINRTPWEKGEIFDNRKLERYREKLSRTRLFESVVVEYPQQPNVGEYVPLTVNVSERKFRTLSAGLNYSLNEGLGGTLAWTHRNLTENADRTRAAISYGQVKSKFELDYDRPDFIWPKTALSPSFAITHEHTDSYVSQSVGTAVVLRNEFADNSEYFYGVSLDYDRAKQEGETKHGKLFGVPLGLKYDQRDDLFDPTKGYIINATISPRIGRIGDANFMTKTIVSGSFYKEVQSHLIVASWMRAGSIAGINLSDVVANQRFYSGGGGSVRGYGYQMLGPLDKDYDPTGGKSLVEGGIELRARILEDWGAALFIEGGYVDHNTLPTFKNEMLFGLGAGVRYFTDFGPIRADIAIPLKRRKKDGGGYVDHAMQFYISIGQGF